MTRKAALVGMAWVLVGGLVWAQSPAEVARTAAALAALQNDDGGFAATAGGASGLQSTNSALKGLRFTGGAVPDVAKCEAYVRSCWNPANGSFAPVPGGEPTVATTAIGLMACAELLMPLEEFVPGALEYFHVNARQFEEIRMAIAGCEAAGAKSPDFPAWKGQILEMRHDDGTWGEGVSRAFETASAAAAILRMGFELEGSQAAAAAILAGQEGGGFTSGEGAATLAATYRVMRCLSMMGRTPDLDALHRFLEAHRAESGLYRVGADAAPDVPNTYYALIVNRWARELQGLPVLVETAGFEPLFNGETLEGWEGDKELWKALDGAIVGDSPGIRHNDFLATEGVYGDFVFKTTFRMRGSETANSGIMFRSSRVPPHEMAGYQADVGQQYWGCLYDELRRNKVLVQADPRAVATVRHDGWNQYEIRAMGPAIRLTLNGVASVTYREDDPAIARVGQLAVQIHQGDALKVEFKDVMIQRLPTPREGATGPGWHVRTVDSPEGSRRYTVYLPEQGRDATGKLPVVMFLHGAGERGEDGIVPAQVGLGPAVLRMPGDFPYLVVFPQARESWAGDSADAAAALAALDQAMAEFGGDPRRVLLTGLSMGGRGTWEIAAAYPERFRALVPICGPGRVESGAVLKALPVWGFVGDADRSSTVLGMRAMVGALRDQGGEARLTEYRGVGHNSWDRAYHSPDLARWIGGQVKAATAE